MAYLCSAGIAQYSCVCRVFTAPSDPSPRSLPERTFLGDSGGGRRTELIYAAVLDYHGLTFDEAEGEEFACGSECGTSASAGEGVGGPPRLGGPWGGKYRGLSKLRKRVTTLIEGSDHYFDSRNSVL